MTGSVDGQFDKPLVGKGRKCRRKHTRGEYGLHKHVHFIPGDSKEETNYMFANMAEAFTGAGASNFININVSQ